jgi:hypothetical protein
VRVPHVRAYARERLVIRSSVPLLEIAIRGAAIGSGSVDRVDAASGPSTLSEREDFPGREDYLSPLLAVMRGVSGGRNLDEPSSAELLESADVSGVERNA